MNNGGEAADQMVREALQVTEVAIKLSALGIKNALALSLAYAKENPKVKGKTSLDRAAGGQRIENYCPAKQRRGTV